MDHMGYMYSGSAFEDKQNVTGLHKVLGVLVNDVLHLVILGDQMGLQGDTLIIYALHGANQVLAGIGAVLHRFAHLECAPLKREAKGLSRFVYLLECNVVSQPNHYTTGQSGFPHAWEILWRITRQSLPEGDDGGAQWGPTRAGAGAAWRRRHVPLGRDSGRLARRSVL